MADTIEDSMSEAPETEVQLDLYQIRDLLDVLNEKRVQSFQGLGLTIVFKDDDEITLFDRPGVKPKAQVEDDGHSTSNKPVEGFGFHHPSLWRHQNGKVLTFTGDLE